jgi:phospholipid/cholesterol/gamma-HCH transport system substrate-binding protein
VRWLTRLTTAVIGVAVATLLVLAIRAQLPTTTIEGTFPTWAKFRDGGRITTGSPVVIAGVQIGQITKITIEGSFARVDMELRDDIQVPADSFITRRADSLFGDSYLEIIPTSGEAGAPSERLLARGEQITHVIEGASTDAVLRGMDRGLPRVDNALEVLHEVVIQGRKVVTGPSAEKIVEADRWLASGNIVGPLSSAQQAMVRVDELTTRGANATAGLPAEVSSTLDRIDARMAQARKGISEGRVELIDGLRAARASLDGADEEIAQAAELVSAINEGKSADWKGSLGRLVNDPQLADDLYDASESGREAVGSFYRFKSWLGMRMEVGIYARAPRFYATAELRARTDKFYLVEFEKGPLGGVPYDSVAEVTGSNTYTRHQEIRDTLRFTAQFGKQAGPFAIRGGLKDSTFGIGFDVLVASARLKLSADVFGSFSRTPRVKVAAAFAVFRSIYILGGIDDAFNTPGYLQINNGIDQEVPTQFTEVRYGRDWFLGASLHFDDADLSTLLRVYGALLVGALTL